MVESQFLVWLHSALMGWMHWEQQGLTWIPMACETPLSSTISTRQGPLSPDKIIHSLLCMVIGEGGRHCIVQHDRKLLVPGSRLCPIVLQELLQSSGHASREDELQKGLAHWLKIQYQDEHYYSLLIGRVIHIHESNIMNTDWFGALARTLKQ